MNVYFWLADRFSDDAGLLELAVAAASRDGASEASRIELLLALAYAAPGGGSAPHPEGTIAFGVAVSGDDEHAATLAEEAHARLEELQDHWAAGVRTGLDAGTESLQAAEEIADEPFRVAGLLLDAWVAERREEFAQAVSDYRDVLAVACRASAARESCPDAANTARTLWSSAHARAELADARRALGQTETARALHDRLVDWSRETRPQQPRETYLAALAGSPAAAALSTSVEAPS
jgi:hypothetical protein